MSTFTLGPIIGDVLPNATFPKVQGSTSAIGDLDVYTVPTGRKAFLSANFWADYNDNSGGTLVRFLEVKISGSYYRVTANASRTVNTGAVTGIFTPMILEAGDKLAVNTAITTGNGFPLNYAASIVEFDAGSKLKSARLTGPSSGDNTLYTCPSSTAAMLVLSQLVTSGQGVTFTADGTQRNIYANIVPNGSSPASTNRFTTTVVVSANTVNAGVVFGSLTAGDFVNINVDVGAATQFAWVNILERAV
jgi:hypothetical protein